MLGLIDQITEQHQKTGHKGKYGKKTHHDCLDQDNCQVAADQEVHEGQCCKTGYSGQGGGRNLRDRFA